MRASKSVLCLANRAEPAEPEAVVVTRRAAKTKKSRAVQHPQPPPSPAAHAETPLQPAPQVAPQVAAQPPPKPAPAETKTVAKEEGKKPAPAPSASATSPAAVEPAKSEATAKPATAPAKVVKEEKKEGVEAGKAAPQKKAQDLVLGESIDDITARLERERLELEAQFAALTSGFK